MIFPDMPKRRHFWTQQQIDKIYQDAEVIMAKMKPAQLVEDAPGQISANEWFARHFPEQGRQANLPVKYEISARRAFWERVEFTVICVGMIIWAWYWHQFQ